VSVVSDVSLLDDGASVWLDGADELEVIDGLADSVVAVVVAAAVAAGATDATITHPKWKRPRRSKVVAAVGREEWPSRDDLFVPPPPEGGDDSSGSYINDGRRFGCEHPTRSFRAVLDYYLGELEQLGWEVTFAVRTSRSGATGTGGWVLARRGDLRLSLQGADNSRDPIAAWTIEVRASDSDTEHWEQRARATQQVNVERLVDRLC
jgi:hypothetical protein